MSERLTFSGFPYGAAELKKSYQKHLAEALCLSIVLHFIAMGGHEAGQHFFPEEKLAVIPVGPIEIPRLPFDEPVIPKPNIQPQPPNAKPDQNNKEGRVRKAVVTTSDAEIFEQPAIDAAMQFVFTPALMQSGAVEVWVAMPFKFRLK